MLRGKPPVSPAGDQRVTAAREFLDAIIEYKAASRPVSVLQREDAELRRMLAAVPLPADDLQGVHRPILPGRCKGLWANARSHQNGPTPVRTPHLHK